MNTFLGRTVVAMRGRHKGKTASVWAIVTQGKERRSEAVVFFGNETTPTRIPANQFRAEEPHR